MARVALPRGDDERASFRHCLMRARRLPPPAWRGASTPSAAVDNVPIRRRARAAVLLTAAPPFLKAPLVPFFCARVNPLSTRAFCTRFYSLCARPYQVRDLCVPTSAQHSARPSVKLLLNVTPHHFLLSKTARLHFVIN